MDAVTGSRPVGTLAADISNAIVHLLSRHYGRGPTKAKTYIFDNYVFCVLENVLTTSEQTLAGAGQRELVRKTRAAFKEVLADDFRAAVEKVVERPVIAYHSEIEFDPDMGFEIFVLGEAPH
jgi:uncharacterized protein YbcI